MHTMFYLPSFSKKTYNLMYEAIEKYFLEKVKGERLGIKTSLNAFVNLLKIVEIRL